ncbi:MAG: MMPL family transporter [Acholeplasmataceae bacterium]|nr:MMPL family transporter [Acholeplasmataceae bacterium]
MKKKRVKKWSGTVIALLFWIAIVIASLFAVPLVTINYDSTKYLPDDMKTKQSLAVMEAEFGLKGQANVMIGSVDSIEEALRYKDALKSIDGVMDILWLDTFIEGEQLVNLDEAILDMGFNISEFDITGLNQFYRNHNVLFQVIFDGADNAPTTVKAINEIREYLALIEEPFAMSGTATATYFTRTLTESETLGVVVYILPLALLILVLFTKSWLEPLIYMFVVGVSVLVNMGTNFIFPSVSFLTNSTAMLLQMAIVMDYSIFILNRYRMSKEAGLSTRAALKEARKKSFIPVTSSMLTTVASFIALMFMRYTIGMDMALVMIKGILISMVTAFFLLPVLVRVFNRALVKTEHKIFFPEFQGIWKFVFKLRYVIVAAVLILLVPAYNAQNRNRFIYGDSAISASAGTRPYQEKEEIDRVFGKSNMVVVLVPVGTEMERQMIDQIVADLASNGITANSQALSTLTDINTYLGSVPAEIQTLVSNFISSDWIEEQFPQEMKDQLVSENYSRIIFSIATDTESPEALLAVSRMRAIVPQYYPNQSTYHIIGSSSSVSEIKEIVESDLVIVNAVSIGLVLLILIITLRSLILPFILVFCIEISVWINMAIPYFTGKPIIFIGYLIVSSIQLGATIDYGILLTHNYLDARKTMEKQDALKIALKDSLHSVLTSLMILAATGYSLYFISSIEGVAILGELIGRGGLLSGFFVLFFLPLLLYFFDGIIGKLTWKSHFYPWTPKETETIEEEDD